MGKIIEGNVDLRKLHLTELFDLSDVEIIGSFSCRDNDLTSLRGAPHTVIGYFYCCYNNLTSLEGAPHTVGGTFNCSDNSLTSLEGCPHTVGLGFYCQHNNLTSLEGIPETVGGSFYISKELKDKFPEKYIRSLCTIKGDVVYV